MNIYLNLECLSMSIMPEYYHRKPILENTFKASLDEASWSIGVMLECVETGARNKTVFWNPKERT